ncbi:MAG TPA: signal peptidase II [Nitrospiria bacterium]|nr:signal peptidase II [Nitrospiria bacterium]
MQTLAGQYRLLVLTAAAIVLLDQMTKAWIHKTMLLHQSIPVIPGLFNLTYIRNPGAAFGLFASGGGSLRSAFFIAVSVIALVVLSLLYTKAPRETWLLRFSLSLVMGGAIGNLIDRIRLGEVVDFLDFYLGSYHWPAFNVADSCITIGIGLLILHTMVSRKTAS